MNHKIAKRVYKDYDKLSSHIRAMAIEQIENLKTAKCLTDLPNVKQMKGTNEPYYRMKFSDYRFMLYYDVETNTVEVISLTHRKDTYKKQPALA